MRFNRLSLAVLLVVFLLPISVLADGILDFNIPVNPLFTNFLQISSVEGVGGTVNSGVTLPVTNGSLGLTSSGWSSTSAGSLIITATGAIGPLNLGGTLLQGSFTGITPSWQQGGLELTLDGFSAAINPNLAGYYGLADSAVNGSVYISGDGSSAILAIDPPVAATEGGGIPATLIVLLAAAICFTASVRLKIIRCPV